ncbi:MAG: adenylate/guanylate cyclase domain-containing protein [Moraxellaceae bacterium]|nr:MAG: adenylate/guanylate cyclase domain-containing protein [Moraxellaceae bacterium]
MLNLTAQQAIMFADVSGSSALYKRLGNHDAKEIVDSAVNLMAAITVEHSGTVVKTIGDEIMTRFDEACSACTASIAIQERVRSQFADMGLGIRIGMSFGDTVITPDDVFGDTVNDAAYVAHIARANQIVLTQSVVDQLDGSMSEKCQLFDRINIKGENHATVIYRLAWETSAQHDFSTRVMPVHEITRFLANFQLTLQLGEKTIILLPDQTPFMIGRDGNKADLCLESYHCSREHCHIEFRRGKYVLVDHSTNGTYVHEENKTPIYIRREEAPLQGHGVIGIGQNTDLKNPLLIHYNH